MSTHTDANWQSRDSRLTNSGRRATLCGDGEEHRWQPVSFVFESPLLDDHGRVIIRQPNTRTGRVYLLCMGCHTHTYMKTEWVGYWLSGPNDPESA